MPRRGLQNLGARPIVLGLLYETFANKHVLVVIGLALIGLAELLIRKTMSQSAGRRFLSLLATLVIVVGMHTLAASHSVRTWIDINVLRMPRVRATQKDIIRRILWDPRVKTAVDRLSMSDQHLVALGIWRNGVLLASSDDLDQMFTYTRHLVAGQDDAALCGAVWSGHITDLGWDWIPEVDASVVSRWGDASNAATSLYMDTLSGPLTGVDELRAFATPKPAPPPVEFQQALLLIEPEVLSRIMQDDAAAMHCDDLRRFFGVLSELPEPQRGEALRSLAAGPPFQEP